jgi:hypothetical protein
MGEQISSMVDEDLNATIEAVAEYHDIPKSRAIELLLREGVQARELRYRFEQMDAKLDILIESLGGEPVAREAVSERFETVSDRELPAGVVGVDLVDNPMPYFQSAGDLPDRTDDEATLREALLDERDMVEQRGSAEQEADD